jgi:hypothetical protein
MSRECVKRTGRRNVRHKQGPNKARTSPNVVRDENGEPLARTCVVCEGIFTPSKRKQVHCSAWCWEADYRRPGRLLKIRLMSPAERGEWLDRLAKRQRRQFNRAERYGREHALERLRQLAELDPQAPCPRCLAPLGDDPTRLDLDHDDEDPTRYLGLAHSYCNRAHLPVLLIM